MNVVGRLWESRLWELDRQANVVGIGKDNIIVFGIGQLGIGG